MCVIMVCQKARPTDEMIDRAWETNDDGAGIAWREPDRKGHPEVVFKKGITDKEELKRLCATLPMTYIVHFRIASSGGVKPELTHPFLVNDTSPLVLEGRTKESVLFHNGHWSEWDKKALDSAINTNREIPEGDWSDSRAMAWMMARYGANMMEFLPDQRGVLFSPTGLNVFTGRGWSKINEVWCSNDLFWVRHRSAGYTQNFGTGRLCRATRCVTQVYGGDVYCSSCKKSRDNSSSTSNNATSTAAGGTGSASAPFSSEVAILDLKAAEALGKQKLISKNALKQFRKKHSQARSQNPKVAEKAVASLITLTEAVRKRLLGSGSVH